LKISTVVRIISPDTDPPKVKWFIIVGSESQNLATIYINTDPRLTDLSGSLQALQLPLKKDRCPFLDHDSHADCADLRERPKSEINQLLQKEPGRKEGEIPDDVMKDILALLKKAKTISPEIKKKYGLTF